MARKSDDNILLPALVAGYFTKNASAARMLDFCALLNMLNISASAHCRIRIVDRFSTISEFDINRHSRWRPPFHSTKAKPIHPNRSVCSAINFVLYHIFIITWDHSWQTALCRLQSLDFHPIHATKAEAKGRSKSKLGLANNSFHASPTSTLF